MNDVHTDKGINETERSTMLKLIIGMAIDNYGFDPMASKNKATGEDSGSIKSALDRAGINIDADTICRPPNYINELKQTTKVDGDKLSLTEKPSRFDVARHQLPTTHTNCSFRINFDYCRSNV